MQARFELRARGVWLGAVLVLLCVSSYEEARAAAQGKDQQLCINELNKNFAKVAKAQGKDIGVCIKDGAKGTLPAGPSPIEACTTADRKGKVGKAKQKTHDKAGPGGKCPIPPPDVSPDFGATDPDTVNRVGVSLELDLIHDIFGADLDAVIIAADDGKDVSKCQQAVAKQAQKCADAMLAEYNRCKKDGLRGKAPFSQVESGEELQTTCLGENGPVGGIPDLKGKIQKACVTKLDSTITKKCAGGTLEEAFPGLFAAARAAASDEELRDLVGGVVESNATGAIRAVDALDECGNGVMEPESGEDCDDGNQTDCDGCSAECKAEFCGDGQLCVGVGDFDGDSVSDDVDNCPYTANPNQEDDGGLNTTEKDGIGNACQCGDVNGTGDVRDTDGTIIERCVQGLSPCDPNGPGMPVPGNCDVNGNDKCNNSDATIVRRNVLGLSPFDPADPNLTLVEGQHCENAQPGDGAPGIVSGEQCDDGNQVDGDGCSSECVIEFCGDEVVQLGLGEDCDPPGSPCVDGGVCDGACACPGPIGLQMCVSDRRSFCVGDDPNGRPYVDKPCEDTTLHSDCPPGAPSARCIGNSGIDVNTALGSPFLTIGLAVGIELDCGAIDPATGRAPCTCELRTAEPVDIPGIGVACMGRLGGCGSGEIDCDGGSPFDLALVHDHDIGPNVVDGDPNGFPLSFCGLLDPAAAKEECEAMCDVYCADLAGDFVPLASGCEGFCRAGSREGLPCEFNVDCVDSDCVGGEGVPHANLCGCQCIEVAGNPSRPGALTCEIGLFVLVESAEPCDSLDVTLTVANQCVPFTTERFTNLILNSNVTPNPIGPDSDRGEPVNCAELRAGAVSGLTLVGNSTNFDSQLGDLSIPLRQSCE